MEVASRKGHFLVTTEVQKSCCALGKTGKILERFFKFQSYKVLDRSIIGIGSKKNFSIKKLGFLFFPAKRLVYVDMHLNKETDYVNHNDNK